MDSPMRSTKSMMIALPLAACAIGDDGDPDKLDDPLTLSGATPVANEGVLAFGATVFAENPTTLLERGDFHGYEFHGKAGGVVTITMTANVCTGADTMLHLFGPEGGDGNRGADLISADDSPGLPCLTDSRIAGFTLPVDGEYLIVATSFQQRGGGHYKLTLTCDNGA